MSTREAAQRFRLTRSVVSFWVRRCAGKRLDRTDFGDRKPGWAWNRTKAAVEQRIVQLRTSLREDSVLGEHGARAIRASLLPKMHAATPSEATINRVLARYGMQDGVRRIRRAAPPKGWYLPTLAAGRAEMDCFDFIEDLKIAKGPIVDVLTAKSLHGSLIDAWVQMGMSAERTVTCMLKRWQREGLPTYAQFDNGTVFQGAHQFPNTVGRVSRLCLQLGVIPVFVPPLEYGMQNIIESLNGLWQTKVWQRHHVGSPRALQRRSDQYTAAHRARAAAISEAVPARQPMPKHFEFNVRAPLRGLMMFIRRTNRRGHVYMLGQRFAVSSSWPHRLVRCEVDFDHQNIRFFGLRRRAPSEQPLLLTIPYDQPHKPFRGKI